MLNERVAPAGAGFHPDYFGELFAAEAGNYWFVNRNRLILWAIKRFAPAADAYLEVGCGTGYVLSAIAAQFPHLEVTATEIFAEGLDYARKRVPRATFLQVEGESLPFREQFDLVGAFDVIEHIGNDRLVLRNMHTALRPGGCLVLTVPQHPFLWSAADDKAFHKRRYTRRELVGKVEEAGFSVAKVTSFVSLLFPLLMASRLSRKNRDDFNVMREMKVSPALNRLLLLILSAESALIRGGIDFPFGGSLLLIAHKKAIA